MKMPRLFNPTRAFASLRIVVAGACVLTAAALAFVATANNNSSDPISKKRVVNQSSHDSPYSNYEVSEKDALADPNAVGSPDGAAAAEYARRAYPGPDEIDLGALINAQAGMQNFLAHATPPPVPTVTPGPTDTPAPTATPTATPKKKKGGKKGKKGTPTPTPTPVADIIDSKVPPPEPPQLPIWHQVGDTASFTATDPNVLTFTGSTQRVSGRITALALDQASVCTSGFCRLWAGAAGGGIWRTTNALAGTPTWTYISGGPGGFVTNAIGALTYDNARGVLYAGTGEPNASGDSEAGVGIYKSTNGGDTWDLLPAKIGPITTNQPGTGSNGTYTGNAFLGRSISSIVVDPTNANILYVSSARGVRGVSSVTGAATSSPTTPRPPFGLFKSVDGGNTFTFIFDGDNSCGSGTCLGGGAFSSIRGATEVELDPTNNLIVYEANFPGPGGGGGVFRSTNGGSTFTQIKAPLNTTNVDRCAFDVTTLPGGNTRMYVGCGNGGSNTAHFFRSDLVQSGAPAFTDLTALETVPQTSGYCTGQCWYDNFVYTPLGFPDFVYLGGSYDYATFNHGSDGRGVLASNGAGVDLTWYDWTSDAQNNGTPAGSCCQPNAIAPNGIHPDQHAIVFAQGRGPQAAVELFFEGSDGGVTRSDGDVNAVTNISGQCAARTYGPGQGTLAQCTQLLRFVPVNIFSLNVGLDTLQFQSVSVAGNNVFNIQGGTQDNGTWNEVNDSPAWNQEIYGDGGQSGFNVANSNIRYNTFTGQANDGNFQAGAPTKWVEISGPILFSCESAQFYPPFGADPAVPGTVFQGSFHVWRTQDNGGSQGFLEFFCPEFGPYFPFCGDFVPLGTANAPSDPALCSGSNPGDLGGTFYGVTRFGGVVEQIARTTSNGNTAWAATSVGRIFVSDNINAAAASVIWNRVDNNGANGDPTRVPTGIAIDPFNVHHAWITYSGYNFNTPSQPGHVFSVSWPGAGTATFTDISRNIWDVPITGVAFDSLRGDLYTSSDFVVFRLDANPSTNPAGQWFVAGLNMPMVETAGLTIIPGSRILYAATHGLGIWRLTLP